MCVCVCVCVRQWVLCVYMCMVCVRACACMSGEKERKRSEPLLNYSSTINEQFGCLSFLLLCFLLSPFQLPGYLGRAVHVR